MFGIDSNGVYTARNTHAPDKSLLRQINRPNDLCTPLALETNGTRFHLQENSKKILDVWSQRVARGAYPSNCQRCECSPDKSGNPRFLCHQCISPSIWQFMEEWRQYEAENPEEFAVYDGEGD